MTATDARAPMADPVGPRPGQDHDRRNWDLSDTSVALVPLSAITTTPAGRRGLHPVRDTPGPVPT
jgi:hypothetical protein